MNKTKNILTILLSIILTINSYALNVEKPNGTLPVELLYFVGDVVDSVVELRWGTATELNNYGYNIHRADTSFVWETLDFVQGHGTSYSPKDYLYRDTTIADNGNYFYRLKQVDTDGNFEMVGDTVEVTIGSFISVKNKLQSEELNPGNFKLFQNYPNPFNPETNIEFYISEQSFITLKLFAITGEELKTIVHGIVTAGTHKIIFKPNNLSSGTYIYKLNVENKSVSKIMLLLK